MSINDFISIGSICISILALIFSVITFFDERRRNRKEATIHAFDDLDGKICSEEYGRLQELDEDAVTRLVNGYKRSNGTENPKWDAVTKGLALIEHFAVGINTKVYDVETLNAMAGNFMIKLYETLLPIIKEKRSSPDGQNNYKEFKQMMEKLECIRRCSCA